MKVKKYITAEGAALYSLGLHTFQEIAKEANVVYKVTRCVLVNTEKILKCQQMGKHHSAYIDYSLKISF